MLDLVDVSVEYGKHNKVIPLTNVNFHLEPGDFVTITGRSGSGKTTFVQVCGGLLTPTTGRVMFRNTELHKLNDTELSRIRNTSIGFVFQSFNLVDYLTAAENVSLPLVFSNTPPSERSERAARMLNAMGLSNRADHYPGELSGGERQRVAIARALVTEPDIIIADEPTGNLDFETSRTVMEIFSEIHRQRRTAILLVTHNPWIADFGEQKIHIIEGTLH